MLEVLRERLADVLPRVPDREGFFELCRVACDDARAQHPDVDFDPKHFAEALVDKLATDDPVKAAEELDWAELWVAVGCAQGSRPALEHFDGRLLAAARSVLGPMKLDPSTVDDVLQRVRQKLLVAQPGQRPLLLRAAGRGQLKSFVRVVAAREALTGLRQGKREDLSAASVLDGAAGASNPELTAIRRQYAAELKAAFQAALATLSSRQRNLLRLQIVDHLPVERIAALYQVHRVTASRWLAEARAAIAQLVHDDLRRRLQVDTRELASLVRAVQSDIDMSVERILDDEPPASVG